MPPDRLAVEPARLRPLNAAPARPGSYVLYWMQASVRVLDNPALEVAAARADELGLPLLAVFGLTACYPEAALRHYVFLVEGLADAAAALAALGRPAGRAPGGAGSRRRCAWRGRRRWW